MHNSVCENSMFSLQLFPANVCVCAMMRVKIPHFRCGYSRLICVCVCVCATRQESCENSAFLLQLFPANVCMCVCYIACENSAFSLRLFLAYMFRALFRERGIKLKPFFLAGIFGCPTMRKFCEFVAAIAGLLLFIIVCLSLSGVSFIYFLRRAWVYSCFVLCHVWATACTCMRLLGEHG